MTLTLAYGRDTRVSRLADSPRVSSSYDMRLCSRIIDSVRDETRRECPFPRKTERGRYIRYVYRVRAPELKSFHRRNNLPRTRRFCGLRRKGTKAASGQPLLRPGHDRGHRRREAIAVWRIHLVVSFDGSNGNCKRVSSVDVKKVNFRKIHGSL